MKQIRWVAVMLLGALLLAVAGCAVAGRHAPMKCEQQDRREAPEPANKQPTTLEVTPAPPTLDDRDLGKGADGEKLEPAK